ncbi:unnamed protein product, partial [Allacma fusca]
MASSLKIYFIIG